MTRYLMKTAGETRDVAFDWTEALSGEAIVETLAWTVVPQELDAQALVLSGPSTVGAVSSARAEGGRPGHVYHVGARVRTEAGRVLSRAVLIRVVEI